MLGNPPTGKNSSDVVWPSSLAKDQNNTPIGFFMPSLPPDSNKIHAILSPAARQRSGLNFSIRDRLLIGANLATAVANVHSSIDRAIGDVNESNIYVTTEGFIRIIDTDSFQIQGFRCPVGKPEYTPPELQGKNFSQVDRTANHDAFGLAVLIYLILGEGLHPYVASTTPNASGAMEERIKNYQYPISVDPHSSPANLTITDRYRKLRNSLPPKIYHAFAQAFNNSNDPRPTARQWEDLLREAAKEITHCPAGHEKFGDPAACRECTTVQQPSNRGYTGPTTTPGRTPNARQPATQIQATRLQRNSPLPRITRNPIGYLQNRRANQHRNLIRTAKKLSHRIMNMFYWAADNPVSAAIIAAVVALEVYLFSEGTGVVQAAVPIVGGLIFWAWWNR